jgi:universal stress protein E
MPPIRTVLVAVKDPNSKSLPAVAKGARLARGFGARLELFHGITDPVLSDAYFYENGALRKLQRETKARYLERLNAIAAPLQEDGLKVGVSVDWDFPAHEAIVRAARRHKADLIVAECHAGRRLAPWLLHLTDWELLRTSPVPVLLVKSGATWEDLNVLAAIDPSHAFSKPAKLDSRILSAAAAFNSALKGTLHVVHSYIPVPVGAMPMVGASALSISHIAQGSAARAKQGFERAIASYRLPKNRQHLVQGVPVEEIPRVASEVHTGLVVMGAISRSGLKRAIIGNTAERVLSALPCDVLVVKPLEFRGRVARKSKGMHFVGLERVGMGV